VHETHGTGRPSHGRPEGPTWQLRPVASQWPAGSSPSRPRETGHEPRYSRTPAGCLPSFPQLHRTLSRNLICCGRRPTGRPEDDQLRHGLHAADAFPLRRCQILLATARGETARTIAGQDDPQPTQERFLDPFGGVYPESFGFAQDKLRRMGSAALRKVATRAGALLEMTTWPSLRGGQWPSEIRVTDH